MGIVGPFVAWIVYKSLIKSDVSSTIAVFLCSIFRRFIDLCSYIIPVSSCFPTSYFGAALYKFLIIFAVTQIPLAIGEGILTVIIWDRLKVYKPKLLKKLDVLSAKEN